jgi:hypothetical protein
MGLIHSQPKRVMIVLSKKEYYDRLNTYWKLERKYNMYLIECCSLQQKLEFQRILRQISFHKNRFKFKYTT